MNEDQPNTLWPTVLDDDTVRDQVAKLRRRLVLIYFLIVVLTFGQALAVSGVLWKISQDDIQRAQRFCVLAQQAIDNAAPGEPVSPLLIASAEVARCVLVFPPDVTVR